MTIATIAFMTAATNAGSFDVVRVSGQEAISAPFRFELTLASTRTDLDGSTLIGQQATLTFRSQRPGDPEMVVPYHGIVTSFVQGQRVGTEASAKVYYRARLEPQVAKLAHSPVSAVFVDHGGDSPTQTAKFVVEKVLDRAKNTMPGLSYEFRQVDATQLRKRDFFCQFEESDLAFISRLLEAEGLYYFFEHSDAAKDKLIITGQRSVHVSSQRAKVKLRSNVGIGLDDDMLASFVCTEKMLPNKLVLRGYSPDAATRGVLTAQATVHSAGIGEAMLHAEDFRTDAEGTQLATVRAQELACRGKTYVAEGSATGLRPGFLVELSGHFNTALNDKRYLITQITHEATQAVTGLSAVDPMAPNSNTYSNTFTAIPFTAKVDDKDVQFRPERLTAKPKIHGTITAFIDDDSSGQYASIDAKGRYKVVLPFADYARTATASNPADPSSYNGKGSARIRMATAYSGSYAESKGPDSNDGYRGPHGIHFPLHKHAEVLLSFIDGDPDRPIIVGAVPNSRNTNVINSEDEGKYVGAVKPPKNNKTGSYNAPRTGGQDQGMILTAGGNRLLASDREGAEGMLIESPYLGSYLRVGKAFADEAGMDPGSGAQIHDPDKVGLMMYTNGDGVQYFTGSFISITGVGDTEEKPEFGKLSWQIEHGWNKDLSALPGSDTELNLKNNITHTKANNIERTLGNNESTTIGDTIEYTKGNTTSTTIGNTVEETRGNTTSTTYGNTTETTYGNSDSIVRGNSTENIWGNVMSSHMGATQEFFLGDQLSIALAATQEIKGGMAMEFALTNSYSLTIGANQEVFVGFKFELSVAASIEMTAGPKTELEYAGGLKFKPAFDAEVATNDIKTKVNEIATRTNLIQTNVNKIISTPVMVDTGAMHIQSKGLTLLT